MTSASKFKVRAGKIHLEKFLCQFSFSKSQVTFALKKFPSFIQLALLEQNKNGIPLHDREQITIFIKHYEKLRNRGKIPRWKYSN